MASSSDHGDDADSSTTARLRGGIWHFGVLIVCVFTIPMERAMSDPAPKRDPASSANFNDAIVEHIALDWNVDFEAERIFGIATLDVRFLKRVDKLILDGRSLVIEKISASGFELNFEIEDAGVFGEKIVIDVGTRNVNEREKVEIKYSTGKGCIALQFLKAQQTVDKKGPYLFSQCESIYARSLLPCMDTPSVKQTYEARVTVPKGLTCLMSAIANRRDSFQSKNASVFSFAQRIPIPSYLIAIVVGVLEERNISDRSAVWSEPSVVDKALFEFSETESMLNAAESIAGRYIWGRYDLVVLPASFPFGGMENPCLTFVTPSVLAGDRSLSNVIAHEIAHSWTGNLVTNANWEHFWLNEGFTVFLERKIIGLLEGENMRQFQAEVGWEDEFLPAVRAFTDEHPYTCLVQQQDGVDPDDAHSVIPYEKGSALLMYLEQQLGDMHRFEKFLRSYIEKFSNRSITTNDCLGFLYNYFPDKQAVLDAVNWENWLYEPGIPKTKPKYDGSLLRKARQLANRWIASNDSEVNQWNADEFAEMSALEQIKVLRCIYEEAPMPEERLKKLGDLYDLQESQNSELLFAWISVGLKARFKPIIPTALKFVATVGRLKFVRPVYKELFSWEESSADAIEQFQRTSPSMHPITASTIRKLIPA